MNKDNTTTMNAKEYDRAINDIIPYYKEFHDQTISVIKNMLFNEIKWLDLGCGTGSLANKAKDIFPKVQFVMVDPSQKMLEKARKNNNTIKAKYLNCGSEAIMFNHQFNVVTAIQAHHYMKKEIRVKATKNVYQALCKGGVYITFENVIPETDEVKNFELQRWGTYQLEHGRSIKEVEKHLSRCGVNYFPLTINEHFKLLKSIGFTIVHIFWYSFMQVGIYAIK